MSHAGALRAELAEALLAAGPDAPTLCEGWQTRHLAAHVVLRERSLVVGAGLVLPPLAGRAQAKIDDLADQAATEGAYRDLVARVADGAARWHPPAWAPEAGKPIEFFVHTEDVRRGAGDASPRTLPPELTEALWKQLLRSAGLRTRRSGVGLVLVREDGRRARVRKPSGDSGVVVARGAVGELVLWSTGRGGSADVSLTGHPTDVTALSRALPVG
jgi:uncharacterized protein (TIGR03085 family)